MCLSFCIQGFKIPLSSENKNSINSPGQLYIFDFNSPEEGAKIVPCNNFPTYGTKEFGPHGMGLLQHKGHFVHILRQKALIKSSALCLACRFFTNPLCLCKRRLQAIKLFSRNAYVHCLTVFI